ncbi:MAG: hypothetical protein ACLFQV_13470, partial [Vulcanimicrobiota bacterium]
MPDSAIDRLINIKNAFHFTPGLDELFLEAMREAFVQHYNNCVTYKKLCHLDGFSPEMLQTYNDLFQIPHLMVNVLKAYTLTSVPDEEIELTLTSSGTTGQKSQIHLDKKSLGRIRKIVWNIYSTYGMADKTVNANCLLFSYEYEHARNLGTSFSDDLLSGLTSLNKVSYALKFNRHKQDFELDVQGVLNTLEEYNR